jgi:hypothetical protein
MFAIASDDAGVVRRVLENWEAGRTTRLGLSPRWSSTSLHAQTIDINAQQRLQQQAQA